MRRFLLSVLATLILSALGIWLAGTALTMPIRRTIGDPPSNILATNINFLSSSGATIRGWFVAGQANQGVMLLLHGVRADRRAMLSRASLLHSWGYNVLLIDLQAHGESTGQAITFGALEAKDVQAALKYIEQNLPRQPVGIIGMSLGGAATVLAEPKGLSAVVLESVYPTIEDAVSDRLRRYLGYPGTWLAPLLLGQLEPRLGIKTSELRPIDHIQNLDAPLLLLHGTKDRNTTLDEAKRLFAASSEPKSNWYVPGAGHEDLFDYAPGEYRNRLKEFLDRTMRAPH